MSLPVYRRTKLGAETIPHAYKPDNAMAVIQREAKKTRLVGYGQEHHLPQTRSVYESLLRALGVKGIAIWRLKPSKIK